MTREEMRAIVNRHAHPRMPAEHRECPSALDALHADRGALLELLRRVASNYSVLRLDVGGVRLCPGCLHAPCEPDCPAPLLEALR